MNPNEKIVWNIKRLMEAQDVSQGDLARRLGMHRTQISNYLNGKHKLPTSKAEAIANALGVGLDALLGTPPPQDLPPREMNELEILEAIVGRWNIDPDRKAAILGLLVGFLEEERLAAVRAVLAACPDELSGILDACKPVFDRLSLKGEKFCG